MSLQALVTTAKILLAAPPDPAPADLPAKVNSAFDKLIGMLITIGGAVAVACLVGAGIMLMFGETGHGSPGAKFVKIFGGLGVVLGAGSLVGLVWAA
jgi:type IV secretory pathway VirB2 component (pilin)